MQGEMHQPDLNIIVVLQFFNPVVPQITPGTNIIAKDFKSNGFRHDVVSFV